MLVGVGLTVFIAAMSIVAPFIAPHDPTLIGLGPPNSPPSAAFPMGTDQYGRDLLSRIIWGGRFILLVAVAAVAICLVIGLPIGLVSAYAEGT